jgi:ubiquinone/menaquinone biosynthesis C-methylase UbiE
MPDPAGVGREQRQRLLHLDRLRDIPPQIRLIADPDAYLMARGDAFSAENLADDEEAGISRQHVELIYDVVIRKGLRRGMRVLELGSGGGALAVELAGNVGPAGEVHGLDISEDQLSRARELAEDHGLGNVRFLRGSPSEGLPYEDNGFDLVVSHLALHLMPRKVRCLEEVFRVLKPGGLLALVTACEASWSRLFNAPESWCLIFDYVERHPEEAEGRIHYPLGVFPTLAEMDAWLAAIGFADVDLAEHLPFHRIPLMSHRAYWSMWIDAPLVAPITAHVQATAARIMSPGRVGYVEPRLEVFARKP